MRVDLREVHAKTQSEYEERRDSSRFFVSAATGEKSNQIKNYRSVTGLYFGTSDFMTDQATKYANAHPVNIIV
jgi:hypothetical protein